MATSHFRSFHSAADDELLDYLRSRQVSPTFLKEIDQYLALHPQIAIHRPLFLQAINHQTPLQAYQVFVKGFKRPARYVRGALPGIYEIPLPPFYQPRWDEYDSEMIDLFHGEEYRYDMLHEMDDEVAWILDLLHRDEEVPDTARKLLALALYGNLVDAFKYYQYNDQQANLQERYLPEHVEVLMLPEPAGHIDPLSEVQLRPVEGESSRSYPRTRARMARAFDEGIDVIDVLLDEFTVITCRQGLKRHEIGTMQREALRLVQHQRSSGEGREIVEMVMDLAAYTTPAHFGR